MTKKEFVIEKAIVSGAKEVNGIYEMTEEQFLQLDAELENEDFNYAICKNVKDESLKAIYDDKKKNKYITIKIIVKKTKTKKSSDSIISSKPKFDSYTIKYKETRKKENTITSLNTCEEIKVFLKSISKKTTEYLHIYKNDNVPTRKSAWIN